MLVDIDEKIMHNLEELLPNTTINSLLQTYIDNARLEGVNKLVDKLAVTHYVDSGIRRLNVIKTIRRCYKGVGLREAKKISEMVNQDLTNTIIVDGNKYHLAVTQQCLYQDLLDSGATVIYNIDPQTIVQVRDKYGEIGRIALETIFKDIQ